jgi:hypothetical protein
VVFGRRAVRVRARLLGEVLLGLERDRDVDRRLAVDFQEAEAEQARDDANQHAANQKRPDHAAKRRSVAGKAEQMPPVVHKFMHIHARKD